MEVIRLDVFLLVPWSPLRRSGPFPQETWRLDLAISGGPIISWQMGLCKHFRDEFALSLTLLWLGFQINMSCPVLPPPWL